MKKNIDRTIMIVDDDVTHRALMSEIITEFGFSNVSAENGAVALIKLQNGQHVDLVFMDLNMPEMDGLQTTRLIRALQARKELPVFPIVAFTSNQDQGDLDVCLSAGMNDYVHKEIWLPKWRHSLMSELCKWLPDNAEEIKEHYAKMDGDRKSDHVLDFDLDAFNSEMAKEVAFVLKRRFAGVVDAYFDDAHDYIDNIRAGFRKSDLQKITQNARTLRTSSETMGAVNVYNIAKVIEFDAKDAINNGGDIDHHEELVPQLEVALQRVKPKIMAFIAD